MNGAAGGGRGGQNSGGGSRAIVQEQTSQGPKLLEIRPDDDESDIRRPDGRDEFKHILRASYLRIVGRIDEDILSSGSAATWYRPRRARPPGGERHLVEEDERRRRRCPRARKRPATPARREEAKSTDAGALAWDIGQKRPAQGGAKAAAASEWDGFSSESTRRKKTQGRRLDVVQTV